MSIVEFLLLLIGRELTTLLFEMITFTSMLLTNTSITMHCPLMFLYKLKRNNKKLVPIFTCNLGKLLEWTY